jgi:Ribonuclease G/E
MEVMERAAAAALVVDEREQGTVPVLLHWEMGQTLTTVRDFFTEKVQRLVVDSHQSYQEVSARCGTPFDKPCGALLREGANLW